MIVLVFFIIFSMGMDLRGSILLNSGSFVLKFCERIKIQFQCILM